MRGRGGKQEEHRPKNRERLLSRSRRIRFVPFSWLLLVLSLSVVLVGGSSIRIDARLTSYARSIMSRTRWLESLLLVVAVSVVAVSTNTTKPDTSARPLQHIELQSSHIVPDGSYCGHRTTHLSNYPPISHVTTHGISLACLSAVFLVGFARFLAPHEARSLLDLALTNATATTGHHSVQWEIVHRNNAASEYPSDFGVIKVRSSCTNE